MKPRFAVKVPMLTLVVMVFYLSAARAQAPLIFSGGGGSQITITLQTQLVYTLSAPCRTPVPIFKNTGNPFGLTFPNTTGTMSFTIDGGPNRTFSVTNSGSNYGDVTSSDIFISYPNSGADPTLPAGTVFRLNAGTLTTIPTFGATAPQGGFFTTYLICASTTGLRTSPDAVIPTAAAVSVSGRITISAGRGLANAVVTLTDSNGNPLTARSNPFGYYRFEGIPAGQTVVVAVSSKHYQFAPQVIGLADDLSGLDFAALSTE